MWNNRFPNLQRLEKEFPGITYLDDTLVVRIVAREGEVFTVEEFLTSDPASRNTYLIAVAEDSLEVGTGREGNFNFCWFSGCCAPLTIPLKAVQTSPAELKGWDAAVLDCQTAPCLGFVEGHEQLGSRFERLNRYHNYGPLAYDGNGYYCLYSEEFGIVRAMTVCAWFGNGYGLDLILSND